MASDMEMLRTIPYVDLFLWDVKRFVKSNFSSKYPIVELNNYIEERSEKVKLFKFPNKQFGILGVNNKIGFFDAYQEFGENINQAYKRVEVNDLAYNPYRINVGSIGWKTTYHKHEFISPAYVVFRTLNDLCPEFLYRMFKTNTFNQVIKDNTTGSVRQNLKFDTLSKLKIPLPPLNEQKRIVSNYNAKIALAQEQEQRAAQLKKEIEEYLLETLGVERQEEKESGLGLSILRFTDMHVWGVDKLLRGCFESVLTSTKYPNKKISNLVYVNPTTDLSLLSEDDKMSFIPMKYICDEYGEVTNMDVGYKKKSQGYTKFQNGDLLWARITPCMQNGKSAIVTNLLNGVGYGSTEYHILRKKDESFSIDFLYHLLRSHVVRKDAVNHFTGSAGQQRVPKGYLENLTIPVPPLEKQVEIAAYVFELKEQVRSLQTQAKENRGRALQDFEQEIFNVN